jgi:hypothetical protein
MAWGLAGPAQALHAGGDGAGGDQQYLAALIMQRGDLACAIGNEGVVQPLAVVGDQRAADLDDEALRSAICLLMLPQLFQVLHHGKGTSRQPSPEIAEITKCFFGL